MQYFSVIIIIMKSIQSSKEMYAGINSAWRMPTRWYFMQTLQSAITQHTSHNLMMLVAYRLHLNRPKYSQINDFCTCVLASWSPKQHTHPSQCVCMWFLSQMHHVTASAMSQDAPRDSMHHVTVCTMLQHVQCHTMHHLTAHIIAQHAKGHSMHPLTACTACTISHAPSHNMHHRTTCNMSQHASSHSMHSMHLLTGCNMSQHASSHSMHHFKACTMS